MLPGELAYLPASQGAQAEAPAAAAAEPAGHWAHAVEPEAAAYLPEAHEAQSCPVKSPMGCAGQGEGQGAAVWRDQGTGRRIIRREKGLEGVPWWGCGG